MLAGGKLTLTHSRTCGDPARELNDIARPRGRISSNVGNHAPAPVSKEIAMICRSTISGGACRSCACGRRCLEPRFVAQGDTAGARGAERLGHGLAAVRKISRPRPIS